MPFKITKSIPIAQPKPEPKDSVTIDEITSALGKFVKEQTDRIEMMVSDFTQEIREVKRVMTAIERKPTPEFPKLEIPNMKFPSEMSMSNYRDPDFSKLEEVLLRIELALNTKSDPQPPVVITMPAEKEEVGKVEAGTGSVYGKRKSPHPLLRFPTGTTNGIMAAGVTVLYFDRQPKWGISAFLFQNGQVLVPDENGQVNGFTWSGNQATLHTPTTQGDQIYAWFYQ